MSVVVEVKDTGTPARLKARNHLTRSYQAASIFLSSSVLAETVTLNNVRVWAAPDSTRVVFDDDVLLVSHAKTE